MFVFGSEIIDDNAQTFNITEFKLFYGILKLIFQGYILPYYLNAGIGKCRYMKGIRYRTDRG